MKKLFLILSVVAAAAVACTPEAAQKPAVSFETALPVVAGEISTFTITVADYAGTDPVTIPVTFGGTAVKGTDYTVSAEEFVWGGDKPVTSIQVTTLVFDDTKTLILNLDLPAGWIAGKYPSSQTTLASKLGYVSFEKSSLGLTGSAEVVVSVFDGKGNPLALENDAEFTIAVADESTAQETTHFTLSSKTVTIPAGSKSASFTVAMVGEEAVADHDQLVLVLDPGAKFSIGNYNELSVTIWDSVWGRLSGTWVMNEIITDEDNLEANGYWSSLGEGIYDGLPEYNAEDKITFNIAEGIVLPEFKSTYKNYFIGESEISKGGTYQIRLESVRDPEIADVQLIKFANVNRYFHETQKSTDNEAFVGVRMITDEETNEELLDMYVIDYESKSFLNLVAYEYGFMYAETKPTSADTGMFLRATFKKVTE